MSLLMIVEADLETAKKRIAELERQVSDLRVKHEVACSTLEIVKDQRSVAQKALAAQCEETKRLERQVAELRKDAERYQQIRRGQKWSVINGIGDVLLGSDLDAATDAALAQVKKDGS